MNTKKLFGALVMVALTLTQGEALGVRRHKAKRGTARITRANRSDASSQASTAVRGCRGGSCARRTSGLQSRSSARTSVRSQRRLSRGARVAAVGAVRNARRGGSRRRNQGTAVRAHARPQNGVRPQVVGVQASRAQAQQDRDLALQLQEQEVSRLLQAQREALQNPTDIVVVPSQETDAQKAARFAAELGQRTRTAQPGATTPVQAAANPSQPADQTSAAQPASSEANGQS
jgi:hypothetical protein